MPTFFSKNLADLVKKLLRGQQAKRLGNIRGGISAIIKHKWFSSFEWGALDNRDMAPPHKPTIQGCEDVSNFDAFEDIPLPVSGSSFLCLLRPHFFHLFFLALPSPQLHSPGRKRLDS